MIPNGLLNDKVEIFRDEHFKPYAATCGKILPFSSFPTMLKDGLRAELNADTSSEKVLSLMLNGDEDAMLEMFTACRYGAMDNVADFDHKTGELKPDFGLCPRRRRCLGFCVVCLSPTTETGARLTPREMDVLEQLMTGAPDKQSHSKLAIASDTFNELKRRVFAKLGAHSKVEAIKKAAKIINVFND